MKNRYTCIILQQYISHSIHKHFSIHVGPVEWPEAIFGICTGPGASGSLQASSPDNLCNPGINFGFTHVFWGAITIRSHQTRPSEQRNCCGWLLSTCSVISAALKSLRKRLKRVIYACLLAASSVYQLIPCCDTKCWSQRDLVASVLLDIHLTLMLLVANLANTK